VQCAILKNKASCALNDRHALPLTQQLLLQGFDFPAKTKIGDALHCDSSSI
jgi:hypothetical protein